jgi:hypothetical protein
VWRFWKRTEPSPEADNPEASFMIGALLANQVGRLPSLLIDLHGQLGRSPLNRDAKTDMWEEVGVYYLFLTAVAIGNAPALVNAARTTFYQLLTLAEAPLGGGPPVRLPALSQEQLRAFHDLFKNRSAEYDPLLDAFTKDPMNPMNPLTIAFCSHVFGSNDVAHNITLVGQVHVNALQVVKMVRRLAAEGV